MKQKTDYIFFGILGLFIVITITLSSLQNFVLTINNYLAFIALPTALFLRVKLKNKRRYPLGVILMLSLFNIINFGLGTISITFGVHSSILIETPGINPIILLVVIAYYLVNKKMINIILSNFFKGTEEERRKEFQTTVDLYLKKFSSYEEAELKKILENFNDYPDEAKIALRQIQSGNNNIL